MSLSGRLLLTFGGKVWPEHGAALGLLSDAQLMADFRRVCSSATPCLDRRSPASLRQAAGMAGLDSCCSGITS